MSDSILIDIIIELYRKINSAEPNSVIKKKICEIVESNDLKNSDNIPLWFQEFWQCILNEKTVNKKYFLKINGDITNFLAELADVIEMNYEDYGEGITMKFKFNSISLKVFICREGSGGNCFYSIDLSEK